MPFNVIDHYPGINFENVARNTKVKITFNKPIIKESVQSYNFSIVNSDTFDPIPGTFSFEYSSTGYTVTVVFNPSNNMLPNARYEVYVHSKPNSILAQDNDQLQNSYSWSFSTGIELLDDNNLTNESLNLSALYYYSTTNTLKLIWDKDINNVSNTGDIWLTTTNGGPSHTQLLTIPHTYTIKNNEVEIVLTSENASRLESWYLADHDLKIIINANIFESNGRYNSQINLREVQYIEDGVLFPDDLYNPIDHPTIANYNNFIILGTTPKNQTPNLTGITRLKIEFSGLLTANSSIYNYIELIDEDVLN